jgi:hypothetical protein
LQQIAQSVDYPHRKRRPVVPPAPNRHFTNTEEPGSGGITAKCNFEDEIVPTSRNPASKTR